MRDRARPPLLAVIFLAAVAAWIAAGVGVAPVSAKDDGARVATSVCEAHELREAQKKDPSLKIEIPQEFDTPWPTRAACLSHAAAAQRGGKLSDDVAVPPARLAEMIDGVVAIGARHGLAACSWGHAGDGIVQPALTADGDVLIVEKRLEDRLRPLLRQRYRRRELLLRPRQPVAVYFNMKISSKGRGFASARHAL